MRLQEQVTGVIVALLFTVKYILEITSHRQFVEYLVGVAGHKNPIYSRLLSDCLDTLHHNRKRNKGCLHFLVSSANVETNDRILKTNASFCCIYVFLILVQ